MCYSRDWVTATMQFATMFLTFKQKIVSCLFFFLGLFFFVFLAKEKKTHEFKKIL